MSGIGPADNAEHADDAGPGGGGRGRASARPIGISPDINRDPGEDWFRGNRWPPQDREALKIWTRAAAPPSFRPADWSLPHFAVAVLTEFAAQGNGAWIAIALPPPPAAAADIEAEIAALVEIAEFRAGVQAEALERRENVVGDFRGLLTFKAGSHPWTTPLCHAALRVGQFLALHQKKRHMRGRPSTVSPALMPPIDPPGHPAYPSGHATEAYLIALVLAEVMPGLAWGEGRGGAKNPVSAQDLAPVAGSITTRLTSVPGVAQRLERSPLWRIAERIARNREVLGVHFPSDSEAGLRLAVQALPLLLACPLIAAPGTGALARARAEWA